MVESVIQRLGKVWVPNNDPPEVGSVPVEVNEMGWNDLGHWQSVCTAWVSYSHMQIGLSDARLTVLSKRLSQRVNSIIVQEDIKQRTYDLQVEEAISHDPALKTMQEEGAELTGVVSFWGRAAKAYEAYVTLFDREIFRRNKERG